MSASYPVSELSLRPSDNGAQLFLENTALNDLAKRFGTPLYVYSQAQLLADWAAWQYPTDERNIHVCYAVKACSNLSVLRLFAERGAFFDTVSEGEIARVLAAGAPANRVVFSGVAKSEREITFALEQGIFCFNAESAPELERINEIALRMGKRAPVSLRVNPDVDPKTHPYISTGLKANKFGVAHTDALAVYQRAVSLPGLDVIGIDYHIGSQITQAAPYLEATERLLNLVQQIEAAGIALHHIDFGGGLGIAYNGETPPAADALWQQLLPWRQRHAHVAMTLVRGNHDLHAGDPPASLAMALVHEPWQPCATVPVLACHHPQAVAGHTVIAGHLHPTLRLRGPARDALRAPCFGWGDGQLILPAFGAFTGTAPEALPAHWAQFAVLPGRVVAVPGGLS